MGMDSIEHIVYERTPSNANPNSNVRIVENELGGHDTLILPDKPNRPSLSKILVSLESTSAQQQALQHILNALQIMIAREIIVAALVPPHSTSLINNNGT